MESEQLLGLYFVNKETDDEFIHMVSFSLKLLAKFKDLLEDKEMYIIKPIKIFEIIVETVTETVTENDTIKINLTIQEKLGFNKKQAIINKIHSLYGYNFVKNNVCKQSLIYLENNNYDKLPCLNGNKSIYKIKIDTYYSDSIIYA